VPDFVGSNGVEIYRLSESMPLLGSKSKVKAELNPIAGGEPNEVSIVGLAACPICLRHLRTADGTDMAVTLPISVSSGEPGNKLSIPPSAGSSGAPIKEERIPL